MSGIIDGSGNLNTFPDIHAVSDGKLIKYDIKTRFKIDTKRRLIECLIQLIKERGNESIKQYGIDGITMIKLDTQQPPNYQCVDKLYADDVLAEICDIIASEDDDEIIDTAVNHLCEQMSDMLRTSGTCPSGRVNRCFEVYMFLKDYKDGVHLPKSSSN